MLEEALMFWSKISGVYDLIENIYNGKANARTTDYVASLMDKDDKVLECACGTGMFSVKIAPCVKSLTATDFSGGMPAHLPDTRQLSLATPACSSA